ncbi:MAG: hypothetical protein ACM3O3_12950 [Syntrophothermus sp.]
MKIIKRNYPEGNTVKSKFMPEDVQVTNFNEVLDKCNKMPIITIYYNTTDYPKQYAARMFNISEPTEYIAISESLDGIRNTIPNSMVRLERCEYDDGCIVEVWV